MTAHRLRLRRGRPLRNLLELQHELGRILPEASERRLWLLFLTDDSRIVNPVLQIDELPDGPDDLPDGPDDLDESGDLSSTPFMDMLMQRAALVRDMAGAGAVVLVWERVGSPIPSDDDLEWVDSAAVASNRHQVLIRAQFLLHSSGVARVADGFERFECAMAS